MDLIENSENIFETDKSLLHDWDGGLDKLNDFLDIESNFNADDLIRQLPDDLEIPMLDNDTLGTMGAMGLEELWDQTDSGSSDSGVDCMSLKQEPPSPTSSSNGSEFSTDSQTVMDLSTHFTHGPTTPPSQAQDLMMMLTDADQQTPLLSQTSQQQLSCQTVGDMMSMEEEIKQEAPDTPPLTPQRHSFPGCAISSLQQPIQLSSSSSLSPNSHIVMSGTSTATSQSHLNTVKVNTVNGLKVVFPANAQPPSGAVIQNLSHALSAQQAGAVEGGTFRQVLKSKVKIQPKPAQVGTVKVVQTKGGVPTDNKPLVLTPEEFAKLTSQGVLKFQTSANTDSCKQEIIRPSPAPTPQSRVSSPGIQCNGNFPIHQELDCKLAKRQQRMIKNRESACLSRKRKKEYLTTLEDKLSAFNAENSKLKAENGSLKRQINQLQTENIQLKVNGSGIPPAKKAATFLLGVLFLFSLNIIPFSNILSNNPSSGLPSDPLLRHIPESNIHHGRHLMSASDLHLQREDAITPLNSTDIEMAMAGLKESLQFTKGQSRELMLVKTLDEMNMPLSSMCPSYLNSTESQRLMKELQGWILGHSEELRRYHEEGRAAEAIKQAKAQANGQDRKRKVYQPPRKLKAALRGDYMSPHYPQPITEHPGQKYEVQLFTGADQNYQRLLKTLHARNDTFYVVSFNRDHLLLPATAHNKTMGRPRMSLVMPVIGLNDTTEGSITMMQIDCEVTATKTVHIEEKVVPQHLRQQQDVYNASQQQHASRGEQSQGASGSKALRDQLGRRLKKASNDEK